MLCAPPRHGHPQPNFIRGIDKIQTEFFSCLAGLQQ